MQQFVNIYKQNAIKNLQLSESSPPCHKQCNPAEKKEKAFKSERI